MTIIPLLDKGSAALLASKGSVYDGVVDTFLVIYFK